MISERGFLFILTLRSLSRRHADSGGRRCGDQRLRLVHTKRVPHHHHNIDGRTLPLIFLTGTVAGRMGRIPILSVITGTVTESLGVNESLVYAEFMFMLYNEAKRTFTILFTQNDSDYVNEIFVIRNGLLHVH